MAVELHVIMNEFRLPDVQQWQEAITALGFDVHLDPVEELRAHSGFLPATTRGRSSGFEFDVSSVREIFTSYPMLTSRMSGRDISVNFRFGSDVTEMASATAASAALARLSDGIWFDPQDTGTQHTIDDAIAQARSAFEETSPAARPLHNQTLQRTEAASKRSWFQVLFGRGPGR